MTLKAAQIKNKLQEEAREIAELHTQLRVDFLRRDAIRFPDGWKLPRSPYDDE